MEKINKFYRVIIRGHDIIEERNFETLEKAKDFIKN